MAEIEIEKKEGLKYFSDINTGNVSIFVIWDEYVAQCRRVQKQEGGRYLREWSSKVPMKLVWLLMLSGMAYALQHPDKVRFVE
jgi:hypothetical protein